MANIHTLNDTRLREVREAAEARQRQPLEQESSNPVSQQQNMFSFMPG